MVQVALRHLFVYLLMRCAIGSCDPARGMRVCRQLKPSRYTAEAGNPGSCRVSNPTIPLWLHAALLIGVTNCAPGTSAFPLRCRCARPVSKTGGFSRCHSSWVVTPTDDMQGTPVRFDSHSNRWFIPFVICYHIRLLISTYSNHSIHRDEDRGEANGVTRSAHLASSLTHRHPRGRIIRMCTPFTRRVLSAQ